MQSVLLLAYFVLIMFGFGSCLMQWNCRNFTGSPFEIQCPKNFSFWSDEGFVIKVRTERERVEIDCYKMEVFRFDWLPNVPLDGVNSVYLNSCPVPENFKSIARYFSIEKTKVFEFYSVVNVSLTKAHLEGFQSLTSLTLRRLTFRSIDENLLDNTPNLEHLEIGNNKNLKVGGNFFRNTPGLQSLFMSSNQIVHLPKHLFKNLKKLRILHLMSNNLTELNEDTFSGLSSLESLELTNNLIETITEDAFGSLTQLKELNLQQNFLTKISSNLFQNNKNLEKVLLGFNPNITIPDYLFANLSALETVDLSFCNLNFLPEHIFENAVNLRFLKLNRNHFTHLDKWVFKGLNLEELDLENNYISVIEKGLLQGGRLKKINLSRNRIKTIQSGAFNDKSNLKNILLSHNRLTRVNIFGDTRNPILERIDLSFNNITEFPDINLSTLFKLTKLDLSHNFIKEIEMTDLQAINTKLEVNLRYNNVTEINFDQFDKISGGAKTTVLLENNPIICDCKIYALLEFLTTERYKNQSKIFDISTKNLLCAGPPELKNLHVEMLSLSSVTCLRENISEKCAYSWRPYDRTVVLNCSFNNLTTFPEIDFSAMSSFEFNQTEMHLEGNYLIVGPDSITNYSNVTRLYLSHNKIEAISWLPPKLEVLQLHNNQLQNLGYKILNLLESSNLVNLTLHHNPWNCDCQTANLTNFLRHNTRILDARHIYCFNSIHRLIELNWTDLCHQWQVAYLVLILLAVLLFFVAFAFALYYRYQQELKVWLFAHNLCLCWVTEEELDKDKIYDAFISYSHKDEDFVTQNLLPVLEGGLQPYKLCLHYRNWIPGEFITTQVTNSVLESRRTLVVLSPNFLESVWGKMEFRTAHTQAMTEGRARVIIVLYGDVDVDTLDDELKTYLKTNTYVKWGDPYFWNKLKYALPHTKRNVANQQKIANVLQRIDNKFKLVAPVTNSPGSTPPVLALDQNMLKHPLSFVSRQEIDTPPDEAKMWSDWSLKL